MSSVLFIRRAERTACCLPTNQLDTAGRLRQPELVFVGERVDCQRHCPWPQKATTRRGDVDGVWTLKALSFIDNNDSDDDDDGLFVLLSVFVLQTCCYQCQSVADFTGVVPAPAAQIIYGNSI